MELDVNAIEQQLQEIESKKSKARERLEYLEPRGRGRGRGGRFGARDQPIQRDRNEHGRKGFDDHSFPGRDRDFGSRRESEPSVFSRMGGGNWRGDSRPPELGSRAPGGRLLPGERSSSNSLSRGMSERLGSSHPGDRDAARLGSRFRSGGREPVPQLEQPRPKPKLSSAVVINGDTVVPGMAAAAEPAAEEHEPAVGQKRPASDVAPDSAAAKRTRRFLGSLLVGTLNRAKKEASQFQESEVAHKRQEMLRKAEERQAAEAQRLREEARRQRLEQRRQELDNISSLNLQTDLKNLELLYAKKIARHQQLLELLITKAGPPVYWRPAQHTPETLAALQQRAGEFDGWKEQQLQHLAQEQQELQDGHAQRRAKIATRIQHAIKTGQEDVADEEDGELAEQQQEAAAAAKKPMLRSKVVVQVGEQQEQQQKEQQQDGKGNAQEQQRERAAGKQRQQQDKGGEEDGEEGGSGAVGVDEEGELTAEALRRQEEETLAEANRMAQEAEDDDILGM